MKLTTRDMILVGLFAALMVVGAFLKIPTPFVPVTFQLFFCIYAGLLLGAFKGAMSQIIYVAIGLIGIPVFSDGGGFDYVLNSKFGFILGFILCATVVGYFSDRMKEITIPKLIIASTIGFLIIYVIGDLYMYMILNYVAGAPTSLLVINGWMIPFMIKDYILILMIVGTTKAVLPNLRKAGYV